MTVITQHKKHRDRLAWAALVAFLALLIGYDLRWLSVNVTLLGWDPPSHLLKTLTYARLLQDHSAQSLFSIFTWDLYRPPLFHLSAVPLYWLLGYSTDVATAMNAVWLAGLVLGTFFLGRRLFGATAGLWSAMFVGLYPMVFCLAHYFYLEVAVSALVVWSVWTLLAAEGFTRRPYSLLLGLLVEAGMLVKWTYAAYFVFPLLVVLAYQWQRRHLSDVNLRINNNRWALVSLGVSGLLTMAWYGPNWELIPTLAPGRMLPVASFALWAVTIFLVREGRSRVGQLAAAAGMGASVASLWYLPHIDFLDFFFAVAYKGEGTGPAQFAWAEIETYTYYARKLYSEHMGLGFALLTVLATGAWLWHRRHELRKEFALWMLLAWVGGTYVLFTVATIRNTRIIMPVLPALALLTAGGLATIRSATVRRTLIVLGLVFGLAQFAVLNYQGLDSLRRAAGPVFATGSYPQLPATGPTDPGYWIEPDVLHTIAQPGDRRKLCTLINISQIHWTHFKYLTKTEYPDIAVRDLAHVGREDQLREEIAACDYLLFKGRINVRVKRVGQEFITRALAGEDPSFDTEFELVKGYPLPDGRNTVYLYTRHDAGQ